MKAIDFTQPGGFPLTQDQLGYLQTAYTECINALAAMGGDGPFTVSGCTVTKTHLSGTTYDYYIDPGWVYYQGNMIRVPSIGLAGIDESTHAAYMLISPSASPLTYNDGSTPTVIFDTSVGLTSLPIGTVDDSTRFLLSEVIHNGFMPLPSYSLVMAPPNGQTINFRRPQTIQYNSFAVVGVNTITLDSSGAKEGCEVILYVVPNSAGSSITFSVSGFEQVFPLTGTSSLTTPSFPSAPLIIKIKAVHIGVSTKYLVEAFYNN